MIAARFVRPAQPPPPDGGGGGGLGSYLSDPISSMTASAFDTAMQRVWDAGIQLLAGGFALADNVASIDPSSISGDPAGGSVADTASLWPSMVWLAAVIALGLFFYQLISVAVRGGRGMFRAFTGPAQFGIAIALTTGAVATLLTAADGLTTMFLNGLSEQGDFASILGNPTVADRIGPDPDLGDVDAGARPMLLGLAAFFGTIPAGIGFAVLMVFRQAAILVLIATIPITAAGLVADTTASIFWRSARWILAAILMKPTLALLLLVGVNVMARAAGVAGLLAGAAVLLVSLSGPIVLFRLLAFVDPGTAAGAAVRSGREWRGFSEPGSDNGTSEATNIARYAEQAHRPTTAHDGGPTASGEGELGGTTAAPATTRPTGGAAVGGAGPGDVSTASATAGAGIPVTRASGAVVVTGGRRPAPKASTRTSVADPGHGPLPARGAEAVDQPSTQGT